VLSATTYSKSVLRAAAGYLSQTYPDIDYFPAYEIIAAPPSRATFYEGNLRSIAPGGVDVVMATFFSEHPRIAPPLEAASSPPADIQLARTLAHMPGAARTWCDDELLEAFAK
jgi:hypothetical protein